MERRRRTRGLLAGTIGAGLALWLWVAWLTGDASGPVIYLERVRAGVPPGVRVERDVVYGLANDRAHRLDLYRTVHAPRGLMPVILHLHPGGWHRGDKAAHRRVWAWLAAEGYLVASANYRLSGEAPWPAPVEDAKAAVRWLRANATHYGGDPARIGGLGESAGGHLVALIATSGNDEWNGTGGNLGVSGELQAVAAQYAPLDLGAFGPECRPLRIDLELLFRRPYGQPAEEYAAASPVNRAARAEVPFLLIHGAADSLVPIDQSEGMARALRAAGKPVELIRVENAEHNLEPLAGKPVQPSQEEVNRAIAAYFSRQLGR
jgi:acetyl esterase/lipase